MPRLTGDLKERALQFGVDILELVTRLPNDTRGWVVAKQMARSATSVGANIWEADYAYSETDFAHRLNIARKEAGETMYWIEICRRAGLLTADATAGLSAETDELLRILGTIVKRTQDRVKK